MTKHNTHKPAPEIHRVGNVEYTIEPMELPPDASDAQIAAAMQQLIDDCPDCRAAQERGETPTIISGRDIAAFAGRTPTRSTERFRRPRWRDLKRRVRGPG